MRKYLQWMDHKWRDNLRLSHRCTNKAGGWKTFQKEWLWMHEGSIPLLSVLFQCSPVPLWSSSKNGHLCQQLENKRQKEKGLVSCSFLQKKSATLSRKTVIKPMTEHNLFNLDAWDTQKIYVFTAWSCMNVKNNWHKRFLSVIVVDATLKMRDLLPKVYSLRTWPTLR